jgi:hypothetical protein
MELILKDFLKRFFPNIDKSSSMFAKLPSLRIFYGNRVCTKKFLRIKDGC